jgi:hypothetical protein
MTEHLEWNPTATWDKAAQKRFSAGVDRGMLYLDGVGVPWSGLTAVNRRKHDGETRTRYLDGRIYRIDTTPSDYAATINAYTYPDEFDQCIGNGRPSGENGLTIHGQMSKPFSFSYRTLVGDGDGVDRHYKIHLVYNAMADELDYEYATMTETTDLTPFSFDIVGVPVDVEDYRPTSYFSIDSREVDPVVLRELEHVLYGKAGAQPLLPYIEEIREYLGG